MESCRRIDEAKREGDRPSRRGWTQAPPALTEDDGFDLGFAEFDPAALSSATGSQTAGTSTQEGTEDDMNVKDALNKLNQMDGFVGAALVDSESGMMLGSTGAGVDLEIAAARNTEVMRAKLRTMKQLGLDDRIDDVLITLGKQYHIIRPCARQEGMFFYFVLDKSRANLALARRKAVDVDRELQF